MLGKRSSAVSLLWQKLKCEKSTHEIVSSHCIVQQEAFIAKFACLQEIMKELIELVCFIRTGARDHQPFKILWEEFEMEYGDLLLQ